MRSVSINPPSQLGSSSVSDWLNAHQEEMFKVQQHNNNNMPSVGDNGHPPLSPQSSVTSSGSGSDSHQDDGQSRNTFLEPNSGMKGGEML